MSRRVRETIHSYRQSLMAAVKVSDTERCRELLEHLSQTKMTVSLLMETGVAKTLTRLKKETTDEDIRRLTKSLLQQWKAMVRRHNQRVQQVEDQELFTITSSHRSIRTQVRTKATPTCKSYDNQYGLQCESSSYSASLQ